MYRSREICKMKLKQSERKCGESPKQNEILQNLLRESSSFTSADQEATTIESDNSLL